MKVCRSIPDCAKQVLEPSKWGTDKDVQRCISELAGSEQMEDVWEAITSWEEHHIIWFAHAAAHYANSFILDHLTLPPERRDLFCGPYYQLSALAELFADALEKNKEQANEHWPWGESVDDTAQKLRAFGEWQFNRGREVWGWLAEIPHPNRRGRGIPKEIAYNNAMNYTLQMIRHDQQQKQKSYLSRNKQDQIIARLTEVIFGQSEVDADRITARRKRSQRKTKIS
jgi:hypothetical protein